MSVLDLQQLKQHEFDLYLRSKEGIEPKQMMIGYYKLITGQDIGEDEILFEFEKLISVLLENVHLTKALLLELNLADIEPLDAVAVMDKEVIPTEDILDGVAELRGKFEGLVQDYLPQLEEEFGALANDKPVEVARERLARYVLASVLLDDRENDE